MEALICGGRTLNPHKVWEWLTHNATRIVSEHFGRPCIITAIIEGAAPGADKGGMCFAIGSGIEHIPVPAEWERYGRSKAGPIRNRRMAVEFKPDIVLTFPGHTGTKNMIGTAYEHGIPYIIITGDFR